MNESRWVEPLTVAACLAAAALIIFVVVYEPAHAVGFWTGGRPVLEVMALATGPAILFTLLGRALYRRFSRPVPSGTRDTKGGETFWAREVRPSLHGPVAGDVVRIVEIFLIPVALITFGITIWQTSATVEQTRLAQQGLEDQQLFASWEILNARTGGNSGKGPALSFLVGRGEHIAGLDFSCAGDRTAEGLCLNPTYIHTNDIGTADFQTTFVGSNFNDTLWRVWMFKDVEFSNVFAVRNQFGPVVFDGVKFSDTTLAGSDFFGALFVNGTQFENVNLSGADLADADLQGITAANNVDVSGTIFCRPHVTGRAICARGLAEFFQKFEPIFYSELPPIGLHLSKVDFDITGGCPLGILDRWPSSQEFFSQPPNCRRETISSHDVTGPSLVRTAQLPVWLHPERNDGAGSDTFILGVLQ